MKHSSRVQLSTFVEKALEVEHSSYIQGVLQQGGVKLTFSWEKGIGGGHSHNFPDQEAVKALVLTARLFAQGNDQVSFRRLSALESDAGISEEWKDRFRNTRDCLNSFLQSPSIIRNEDGSSKHSYWEIYETFVYGGLAHTGKTHEPTYKSWVANKLGFPLYESEFHRVLIALLDAVYQTRLFSEMELKGEPIPPFEDD